jgi:hypothetical protein
VRERLLWDELQLRDLRLLGNEGFRATMARCRV